MGLSVWDDVAHAAQIGSSEAANVSSVVVYACETLTWAQPELAKVILPVAPIARAVLLRANASEMRVRWQQRHTCQCGA
jgi:hypothetical protein